MKSRAVPSLNRLKVGTDARSALPVRNTIAVEDRNEHFAPDFAQQRPILISSTLGDRKHGVVRVCVDWLSVCTRLLGLHLNFATDGLAA